MLAETLCKVTMKVWIIYADCADWGPVVVIRSLGNCKTFREFEVQVFRKRILQNGVCLDEWSRHDSTEVLASCFVLYRFQMSKIVFPKLECMNVAYFNSPFWTARVIRNSSKSTFAYL